MSNKQSTRFKKGHLPWNRGKKGYGRFNLGKKSSLGTRKKMSELKKKNPTRFWLGKKMPPFSEEHLKRMRESARKLRGNGSPHWKGGYENRLMLNRKRRVMKAGNGGSHTLGDWENLKIQYNLICPCCHKSEPDITLSEDHIIPLSRGGSDNIENIQPLCRSCNSKKHTHIIRYNV